jgi:hemerythrin-like domain-containing protein
MGRPMAKVNKAVQSVAELVEFEDEVYTYSRRGPGRKKTGKDDAVGDLVETLYSEHRYIASLLDTLEHQAAKLKPGKIPDYHLLLEIIDYLTHYPDQYHHPREDLLFSRLLANDEKFKPRLERLQREHETLQYFSDRLFQRLSQIAAGRRANRPELLDSINNYIVGYRKHMDYESRDIFPEARGSLGATDLKKLNAKTKYIDDPLFGNEVLLQYRRLGKNLRLRVGSASQELITREFSMLESAIENMSDAVDRLTQVRDAVRALGRDSWREQLNTVKEHAAFTKGPNIFFLPLALLKNHQRQLRRGAGEVRDIIARERGDGEAEQ